MHSKALRAAVPARHCGVFPGLSDKSLNYLLYMPIKQKTQENQARIGCGAQGVARKLINKVIHKHCEQEKNRCQAIELPKILRIHTSVHLQSVLAHSHS
jgi:hypothetical protein